MWCCYQQVSAVAVSLYLYEATDTCISCASDFVCLIFFSEREWFVDCSLFYCGKQIDWFAMLLKTFFLKKNSLEDVLSEGDIFHRVEMHVSVAS